jgi:hypothetical protein
LKFGRARFCARTTGVRLKGLAPTVRWGHGASALLFKPRCCLGLERENPFRTAGKIEQASSALTFGRPTKKARSVVALSRVPR